MKRPGALVTVLAALLASAIALWGAGALPGAPGWPGAVALLALAGIAGVVAASGIVRRLIGGMLAVGGVATVVSGFATAPPTSVALVAGGLLLGGAGGFVAVREPALRRLGARYARTPDAARAAVDPDRAVWDALDEGRDPTAPDPGSADRPEVR